MDTLYEVKGRNLIIYMPTEIDHHIAQMIIENSDYFITGNNINNIIFDFGKTTFMDSSGIGIILGRYRILNRMGGKVSVRKANAPIERVLTIAGINKLIEIED